MRKIVSDSGVIKVEIRDLVDDDAPRAAQVVAACRDAQADDMRQDQEFGFWYARARLCIECGAAFGLFVNNGAVAGVALALPDGVSGRAIMYAAHSLWDAAATVPALQVALKEWAKSRGLELGRVVRTVTTDWRPV